MNKKAILISVLITTFILGSVAAIVKANSATNDAAQVVQLQDLLAQKDAEYAQTIEEANARLTEANRLLAGTNPTTDLSVVNATSKYAVSIPQAVEAAMRAGKLPPNAAGKAELVDFSGVAAYDVKFETGEQFYIDAQKGDVLFNSLLGGPGQVVAVETAFATAANALPGGVIVNQHLSSFNDMPAYEFQFNSGEQVWVSLGGQVLSIVQVQTISTGSYQTASTETKKAAKKSKSSSHEDEHESEDDD